MDFENKQVTDDAGEIYEYETLFIATGASPMRPPIHGADASNVFTVQTGRNMADIMAKIEGGAKRAVVVGAGAIGIEQVLAYEARGLETWLIDMASHALSNAEHGTGSARGSCGLRCQSGVTRCIRCRCEPCGVVEW